MAQGVRRLAQLEADLREIGERRVAAAAREDDGLPA